MDTLNNLHIPDDLFLEAQRGLADSQGRSAYEPAADALRRYIEGQHNVQDLEELAAWGEQHARARGFKPSDVERAISEVRRARQ